MGDARVTGDALILIAALVLAVLFCARIIFHAGTRLGVQDVVIANDVAAVERDQDICDEADACEDDEMYYGDGIEWAS